MRMRRGNLEIGQILYLKSEIRNLKLDCVDCEVRFDISKFWI
jgi:hypothetical protein